MSKIMVLSAFHGEHHLWCLFQSAKSKGEIDLMYRLIESAISAIIDELSITLPSLQSVYLCPIPDRLDHMLSRGFSPQYLFAERLAKRLGSGLLETTVVVDRFALRRERKTRPQTGLSRVARLAEQDHSLSAPSITRDKTRSVSIIVDDVITTGSTIREGERALSHAGHNVFSTVSLFYIKPSAA